MGGGGDGSDSGAGGDGVPREWEVGTHVWIGAGSGQDWRKGQVLESSSKGLRIQVIHVYWRHARVWGGRGGVCSNICALVRSLLSLHI